MCGRVRELSIKGSMKKNDSGEIYKLRKILLCSILFLSVFFGRGSHWLSSYGWLLSDVVGGHCTNGTKQTQIDELFRLIIVLVALRVATRYLGRFLFYKSFGAFIELLDAIKIRKSCPGQNKL